MQKKTNKSLLFLIDDVNKYIKNEAEAITKYIKEETPIPRNNIFSLLDAKDIKSNNSTFDNENKCSGVYVFKITNEVEVNNSEGDFNDVDYASPLKDEYLGDGLKFKVNDVLYIGKSEVDIIGRVKQHINNDTKKTYSLRLNSKYRCHLYEKIRVYVFKLKDDYANYSKMIVAGVEGYLHEELNPKVGTKRT